jgi:hypothetical protein
VKAAALAAPLLVLGLLHVLQKLERWTVDDGAPATDEQRGPITSRR